MNFPDLSTQTSSVSYESGENPMLYDVTPRAEKTYSITALIKYMFLKTKFCPCLV